MNLTEEQRLAVETQDRPVVLLAAAGSGKTTVLVERYVDLLRRAAPAEILAVTFTNEAAEQLRARIVKTLVARGENTVADSVGRQSRIGTIHSFCYQVLDQSGSHLGLPPVREIISTADWLAEFELAYREWRSEIPKDGLRMLVDRFGHLELPNVARDLYAHRFEIERSFVPGGDHPTDRVLSEIMELARPLFARLRKRLAQEGRFTFDDLENLTLRILREYPDVAARLQKEIRFVLVDEFQDTSQLQWDILQLVLGDVPGKTFVVGDPKQSIYRFRHADVRVFFAAAAVLESRGGAALELTANFRSQPVVIDRINEISQRLFAGSQIPYSPMRAGRLPTESNGEMAMLRFPADAEARTLAARVKLLVESGSAPDAICVLTRVSDRIPEFIAALHAVDIPASGKQTHPLFATHDVNDLVHYLRAVHDPLNDFALAAFLRSNFVRTSYRDLAALHARPGRSLFEKITEPTWFTQLIDEGEQRVAPLLETLFRHGGYFPAQREALRQLLKALGNETNSLSETLDRFEVWEKQGLKFTTDNPGGRAGVSVLTVHAAKGLEFDHVFLVDNFRSLPRRAPPFRWAAGQKPGVRYREGAEVVCSPSYEAIAQMELNEEYEEGKRVLYVALTRAKETLTVLLPEIAKTIPKGSFGEMLQAKPI